MTSPSCRWMCLPFGIRYSLGSSSLPVGSMVMRRLFVWSLAHRAADFGDDRRILRLARLEQLRHPRQTASDVARLGAFGRNTRDHVARLHMGSGIDRDDGVDGEQVAGFTAASQLE